MPEPRPSAKSQVDTPAPGVCRSLFPRGNVLKAEIVRLVAGLQMEVGAMMVGKIVNENAGAARRVQRGEEKGYFAFGGSTVIVLAQKGSAVPEKRIWNYSRLGIETRVRQGETVGTAGRTG